MLDTCSLLTSNSAMGTPAMKSLPAILSMDGIALVPRLNAAQYCTLDPSAPMPSLICETGPASAPLGPISIRKSAPLRPDSIPWQASSNLTADTMLDFQYGASVDPDIFCPRTEENMSTL